MDEKTYNLLHPLLHSTSTPTFSAVSTVTVSTSPEVKKPNPSSNGSPGIIFRLAFIISIGLISIWANHEASKGISITVLNDAGTESLPGKRFSLLYVSNDKASRIVYSTSKFVENFLYPKESNPKKQVNHVILRLSGRNMTDSVTVESYQKGEFVIYISPSIMEEINYDYALQLAVQKGMVRTWMHDGLGGAPLNIVDGIIDYISSLNFSDGLPENGCVGWPASDVEGGCWKSKRNKEMVKLLKYCEMRREGFIRRLNQEMRNGWHDRTVDDALGIPGTFPCRRMKAYATFSKQASNSRICSTRGDRSE